MDIQKIQENIKKNEEKLQKNEALLQKRIEKAEKLSQWLKENNISSSEEAWNIGKRTNDWTAHDNFTFVENWLTRIDSYKDENGVRHYGNGRSDFEKDKIEKIKETIENWKEKLTNEIFHIRFML